MSNIKEQLETPIPKDCISQRAGGGGIKLSYVSGRYVKQRLNEIFGWDGWSYTVREVKLFPEECTAFVHLTLTVKCGPRSDDGFGDELYRDGLAYGHGRKSAEGFDFAIAEAVTDALKRAAVSLGQNLGLELYPMTPGRKAPAKSKKQDW